MEIKPCPFCGSDDVTVDLEDRYYSFYSVICNKCQAEGPGCSDEIEDNWEDPGSSGYTDEQVNRLRQQAINSWNKRV